MLATTWNQVVKKGFFLKSWYKDLLNEAIYCGEQVLKVSNNEMYSWDFICYLHIHIQRACLHVSLTVPLVLRSPVGTWLFLETTSLAT